MFIALGDLIARRHVRACADEQVVEPQQGLPVLGAGLGHRHGLNRLFPPQRPGQGLTEGLRRERQQHAVDVGGIGIDRQDRLAVEVLRDIDHQAIRADGDDQIRLTERELRQEAAFDHLLLETFGY